MHVVSGIEAETVVDGDDGDHNILLLLMTTASGTMPSGDQASGGNAILNARPGFGTKALMDIRHPPNRQRRHRRNRM